MGFRITTNMMMNSYRFNLQGTTKRLSDARDMVLTQRNYNSYAEDPAAATLEFRLRRTLYQTSSQLTNTKNAYSKYNTAWNNLTEIKNKLIDKTAIEAAIRGENGATGEARSALAITLRETAESLIHSLNQKLGDQFIFSGNDGLNVPFTWNGDSLLYRGINVNSGNLAEKPDTATPDWVKDLVKTETGVTDIKDLKGDDKAWYQYLTGESSTAPEAGTRPEWVNKLLKKTDVTGTDDKKWLDYYKDKDNYMKLKDMGVEEQYLDLGMGLAESSANHPINGSYFNVALCGIAFTGFGVDEDGDSLNLAVLMKELADVFETWDEDTQGYNPDLATGPNKDLSPAELEEKAHRLLDKLQSSKDRFVEKWVELDAESVFLTGNQERLETLFIDTETQILDVSQVDLAEAITSFSWQQYCYNAALRIGNQLLSQSLIDYMS